MAFYGNYQKIAIYLSYYYSNIYNILWQYGNSFLKNFLLRDTIYGIISIFITL